MAYFYYKPKRTKEEFQEKAADILSAHPEYKPVEVTNASRQGICSSWWGKAWCENLERYAIWENRITLGRSYIRNGAVIDLNINGGNINALVLGHLNEPYEVNIQIAPISSQRQREIERLATGKIQSLEELSSGNFPEELKEIFFQKGILFPLPDEMDFSCTCRDWANMCRHVAAALYGIGVRLDTDASIFFKMRGIDIQKFSANVVHDKLELMLNNMKNDSPRIFKGIDLSEVFGMEVSQINEVAATQIAESTAQTDETAVQKEDPVNTKYSKDFTEEEKAEILKLGREIGWSAAAKKVGTTVWVIGKWRRDETAALAQQASQVQPEREAPEEKLLEKELPEETQSEVSSQQLTTQIEHLPALHEQLQQLRLENAVLKDKLAMLIMQFNNAKKAIIHLI